MIAWTVRVRSKYSNVGEPTIGPVKEIVGDQARSGGVHIKIRYSNRLLPIIVTKIIAESHVPAWTSVKQPVQTGILIEKLENYLPIGDGHARLYWMASLLLPIL